MLISAFILLSILVVGIFLLPHKKTGVVENKSLTFYKAQLLEIEKDIAAGILAKGEGEKARLEVERRILRACKQALPAVDTDSVKPFLVALAIGCVGLAALLYIAVGNPQISSASPTRDIRDEKVIDGDNITLKEALKASYAELERNPNNIEMRWRLAEALAAINQFSEAAYHYGEGAKQEPSHPEWRIKMGETIMRMHGGQVVPAALLAFRSALKIRPDHPAALYYIAIGYAQGGQKDLARQVFEGIKANSKPNAPWLPQIEEQLAILNGSGPIIAKEDLEAMAGLSQDDQDALILGMVAQLEEKLQNNPDDVQGWLLMARAKQTLEGVDAARATLIHAKTVVKATDKAQIDAALQALDTP